MAQPLPEGVCMFRRSVLNLHQAGYDFDANDENEFYNHVLVEIAWNQAWEYGRNHTRPYEGNVNHPRTTWGIADAPRPQQTSNEYVIWRHFCVGFSKDGNSNSGMLSRYATCNNGNSYRDRMDTGGTVKASFYPIKVPKDHRYMTMDLTSAVRAIYIPVSQNFSQEYEDWCTYAHVSFIARGGSDLIFRDQANYNNTRTVRVTNNLGLGINHRTAVRLDLNGLADYLTMNDYFRDANIKLYSNTYNDPKKLLISWFEGLEGHGYQGCKDRGEILYENSYTDGIGYDKVISANSGLSLQYVPTEQPTTWVSAILSVVANIVGGFVPPLVAPLLHLAIDEAILAMKDPEAFLHQNPLDLATDAANLAVGTAQGARTYADQKKLERYEYKGSATTRPSPMLLSPQYFPGRVKEEEEPSTS